MRNMCRACRFKKCLALGMNKKDVQMNRDPIGRRKEVKVIECCGPSDASCCSTSQLPSQSTVLDQTPITTSIPLLNSVNSNVFSSLDLSAISSTFTCSLLNQKPADLVNSQVLVMPHGIRNLGQPSTVALLPYTPPAGPSLLQRMHEGYANYQSSQKSLYTVMYPDNIFSSDIYRMVKHSEHLKMERGCLSLMFSMVNDWFQPFDTLTHDLKVSAGGFEIFGVEKKC
uniref:Nuclear receptor domain-containing protein n=1 Tax=Bursaphelenchus xylophilus TaxID=6326 RepID=A0A1I7SHX0_BURXY